MRRLVACGLTVLTLVLFLAAPSSAGKYGKKDLFGTWSGDVMAMIEASGMMEQMPPEFDIKAMAALFAFDLTFHDDGTVTSMNRGPQGEESHTDNYEVVGAEGNVLTLTSTDDEGVAETVTVTFSDRDEIVVEIEADGAPPLKFMRAPEKAKASAAE